ELSVLSRQCLDRRIPDRATLERELASWAAARNAAATKTSWRFSTTDARTHLPHLYPVPEPPADHDASPTAGQ
ncbi:MAG: hypothetical protein ACR2OO_04555, partial [Thermomicrobiales bacterium]